MDLPTPGEIVLYRPKKAATWGSDPLPFLVLHAHATGVSGNIFPPSGGMQQRHFIPYGTGPGCWQWRGKVRAA